MENRNRNFWAGQAAADKRDQRDQRIAESMVIDDLFLGQALGAGSPDVVGVQHLQHVGADVAHPRTDGDEYQRHDRQHQMLGHIQYLPEVG